MTVVPSDLYVALLDLGADHDEATVISRAIPTYYAELIGPPLRAMAKRSLRRREDFGRRLEDLERRVAALEAEDWRP